MSLNLSKTFGLIRPMTRSLLLSTSTLTRFAVNGVEAALALDFIGGEYRTANTSTTFADAFTGTSPKLTYSTAAGSNSTMTNSAGEIVWAPHNLVTYSDDLTGAAVALSSLTIDSADTFTFTNSGSHIQLSSISGVATKGKYTARAYISGDTPGDTFNIELVDNADGSDSNTSNVTVSATPQWVEVTADFSGSSTFSGVLGLFINRLATNRSVTAGSTVTIKHIHVYRSDLGGMHPVPGAVGDFQYYVPTNGNAEYLPRVGHHVYNGSTWVNEGLLIESEARTNLITESTPQSGDLVTSGGSFSYVTCNFTPLSGPGIHFDTTGVTSYTYFTPTYTAADYTLSVFVEMDDGNAPTFGSSSVGGASNDFAFVIDTAPVNPLTYIVEHFGGNTYRVSATATSVSTTTRNTGVVKYSGNSSRTFKVTGFQFEQGPTPSSYMPTSGGTYTRTAQSLTVPPAEFGWPEPEYIGPELVVDGSGNWVGDFDVAADVGEWTTGPTSTFTWNGSGYGDLDRNGGTAYEVYQSVTTVVGKTYTVTADVVTYSYGAGLRIQGTEYKASSVTGGSNETIVATFVAASTSTQVFLGATNDVSATASFDNISVREINPLSVSIQMDGRMTYADEGVYSSAIYYRWQSTSGDFIKPYIDTTVADGYTVINQQANSVFDFKSVQYPGPGILTPFNIASRHGSNFVNGAVDGVALTADTTPTALPDLSGTNLQIAYDFMGTVGTFRQFAGDIGDAGLEEATS